LKEKREEVNRTILKDEEERDKIQNDIRILSERLSRIEESLARKYASRNEYDKTIKETEVAYLKVLTINQVSRCLPLCRRFLNLVRHCSNYSKERVSI
jgi:Sjoegren syndrome nuclear autoantigen 1